MTRRVLAREVDTSTIQCFFIKDYIDKGYLTIDYCPSDDMIGNYPSKLLQDRKIKKCSHHETQPNPKLMHVPRLNNKCVLEHNPNHNLQLNKTRAQELKRYGCLLLSDEDCGKMGG